jgi:tetratricopeptide (TPR) repeat protein
VTAEPLDHYEVLGLDPVADEDGIRAAILEQRRTWVRRQNAPNVDRQREAEDRIKAIAAAEDVLLDADRRAAYDRRRQASLAATPKINLDKPPPLPAPPTAPAPSPHERIDWMSRATDALSQGDLRSARYAAAEATERSPGNAHAWILRGAVSRADNRLEHAIYEFSEASRLSPSAETYSALAGANESAGYIDQAGLAYESAVQLNPTAAGPTIALANFWVRRSEPDTAVELLTPLLQRNPTDPTAANALGFALFYRVDSYLTRLHDGTYVFTSARQVQQALSELNYALSLSIDDGDLIGRLRSRVAQATQAEAKVWAFPVGVGCSGVGLRLLGWFGLIFLAFIVIPSLFRNSAGLGILFLVAAVAAVVWGFVKVYRKPGWAQNAALSRYHVARWGI